MYRVSSFLSHSDQQKWGSGVQQELILLRLGEAERIINLDVTGVLQSSRRADGEPGEPQESNSEAVSSYYSLVIGAQKTGKPSDNTNSSSVNVRVNKQISK